MHEYVYACGCVFNCAALVEESVFTFFDAPLFAVLAVVVAADVPCSVVAH